MRFVEVVMLLNSQGILNFSTADQAEASNDSECQNWPNTGTIDLQGIWKR